MLLFVLALATQVAEEPAPVVEAPVEAPAEAPTEPTTSTVVFRRADGGAGACSYDTTPERAWTCRGDELARNQLRQDVTVSTPAGIRASAHVVPKEPGFDAPCLAGDVSLGLRSDGSEVTIDWDRATLIVDDRALPAVPGFAVRATSSLSQRKVRVPPGSSYLETVVSAGGECLVPAPEPGTATKVALELPVLVEGAEQTIRVIATNRWVPISEKDAFSLVPMPLPERATEDPGDESYLFSQISFGVGAAGGAAGGVAAGVGYALDFQERINPVTAWTCGAMVGLGTAVVLVPMLGGMCALPGFVTDTVLNRSKPPLQRQWAWQQKRIELGLDRPAPQAH